MSDNLHARRAAFIERHGYWDDSFGSLADTAPEFLEAFDELLSASTVHGTLAERDRALIMIALTSTPTNVFAPTLRLHLRHALQLGVSRAEIVEIYQLVSALGLHSCTFGVPVLFDELAKSGQAIPTDISSDPKRLRMKEEFVRLRSYWGEFWDQVLTLSPAFFKAYLNFSTVPWKTGHVSAKVKELVYIAIDSNTTHLYDQGLRVHIGNAMRQGATPMEIMEVLQLAATLGMQTFSIGLPLLDEEIERAARKA